MKPLPKDKHPDKVFVFGSNLAGIHGAGAAYFAAIRRSFHGHLGAGPSGTCYAIPTKDCRIQSLGLNVIKVYVDQFLRYADLMEGAGVQFQVTRIGCGLAGFKDEEIAPLFKNAPNNCWFDSAWQHALNDLTGPMKHNYWGTL